MAKEMRNSGIQWIGEIPSTWNTVRFKYLHNGLNTGEAIDKEFWSKEESDLVFYTAGLTPIRTKYLDFPLWKFTQANDILLARNGTPYVYFPTVGACYTDHIIRASMKQNVNRRFVQYALQQSIASVVVDSVSIATWSASLWNAQYLPWPTEEEQNRIVDFLDHKCAEIDSVIADTQRTIEEYKKLKQTIITEAVTKGIRSERPMKDSGIEWIGEIPEDWDIKKGKWILSLLDQPVFQDDGVITCFRDGEVTLRSKRREDGFTISLQEAGYQGINVGDLVVHGMDGFAGAIGISDSRGKGTPVLNVLDSTQNKRYIMYYLRSMAYNGVFLALATGIRVRSCDTNWNKLKELPYPKPSIDEQEELASFIDNKIHLLDELIEKKETLRIELENYKKSVIYEYVTGKKEVPTCQ